jgi:hypothetical protein
MMKFSRAISRVKWLSGEQTNVSNIISVFVLRVLVWLCFIIINWFVKQSNRRFHCSYDSTTSETGDWM